MDLQLKGKKALITGATRGIARATAELFADEGANLAICARNEKGVEEAKKDLEARGIKVFARALDVSDGAALTAFVNDGINELGGLDILIPSPSAGNSGAKEDAWKANFEVDILGTVRAVDAALPALRESDCGSIVFISTTAAVETFMGSSSYNALKAALITHSNSLSQTLGPKGIRVNTVSPGPIYFEGGDWHNVEKAMPQVFESTVNAHPLGRMGTKEEVARAIAFVASPAGSWLTGVNLVVDGGYTKRVNF